MKKGLKTLLKTVGYLALIAALILIFRQIGIGEIYDTVKTADAAYLIIAFLCTTAIFLSWHIKWFLMIRKITKVGFFRTLPILMAGSFINTTTPGARIGGEPLRAAYMSKECNKEKSKLMATIVLDKAFNSVVFGTLSILSMLFVLLFTQIDVKIKIVLEVILALFVFIAIGGAIIKNKITVKKRFVTRVLTKVYTFVLFKSLRKRFTTYRAFEGYVVGKARGFISTFKDIAKEKKILWKALVFTLLMWIFNYIGTYFIFLAFGHKINFIALMIVITLSILLGSLFAVPGGAGVIESVMIGLYVSFGINPAVAAAVAVIDRFIFYIHSLGMGGISLIYLNIRHKSRK